jgi:hypothetical protein
MQPGGGGGGEPATNRLTYGPAGSLSNSIQIKRLMVLDDFCFLQKFNHVIADTESLDSSVGIVTIYAVTELYNGFIFYIYKKYYNLNFSFKYFVWDTSGIICDKV